MDFEAPEPDRRRSAPDDLLTSAEVAERFGVDRLRTLTRSEIDDRFQEFKDFTTF